MVAAMLTTTSPSRRPKRPLEASSLVASDLLAGSFVGWLVVEGLVPVLVAKVGGGVDVVVAQASYA